LPLKYSTLAVAERVAQMSLQTSTDAFEPH